MMVFKKTFCIILVLCFIGVTIVGCGKKGKDGGGNQSDNDTSNSVSLKETNEYGEPSFTSAVPTDELDFEGDKVTVLIRNFVHNSREWYKESPEDELDEAIAMRNEAVSEGLNLNVQFEWVPSTGSDYGAYTSAFFSMVQTDINSGMHYYDISANFGYPTASSTIRDYTANLLDKDLFPYFDFSLPCWNQSIVNETTFNGRLHYVAGDINLSMFDATAVMWYNKTLYDSKREDMDPENLQDLALAGAWTYDELYKWVSTFYEDSNSVAGKQVDDTYALMAGSNDVDCVIAFKYAWDLEFITTNNDGTHSFTIEGNDKAESALSKCRSLYQGIGTVNSWDARNFAAGNAMFYLERIFSDYEANMAIREMEDKYGILPLPKYDIDQEEYATTSQFYFTLMFVLDHENSAIPTKGKAVSAYLQLANEESYTGVRGYYFNRIIKPKFFGTDDSEGTVTKSIALFDIIVSNIKYDYCYIYAAQLNEINGLWKNAVLDSSGTTLEASYRADKDEFENAIQEIDAWFGLRD